MLGQFVTDHPLLGVEDQLKAQCTCQITDLENRDDGELVVFGGIIGTLARKFTKRGEPYAQFRLESLTGGVEVVAFPSVFEAVPELFEMDRIVLATGRIDRRGRELQIRATEVREPTLAAGTTGPGVLVVDLPAAICSPGVLNKLKTLLEGSPGEVPGAPSLPVVPGRAAAVPGGVHGQRAGLAARRAPSSARPVRGAARARDRLKARYRSRMPFTLLPAIDLTDGGLGVYTPTGPAPLDAFGGDPLQAARSCLAAGARWLHVVDMDLAFGGTGDQPRGRSGPSRRCPARRSQASGGVRTVGAGRRVPRGGRLPRGGVVRRARRGGPGRRDPRARAARRGGVRHRGRGRAHPRARRRGGGSRPDVDARVAPRGGRAGLPRDGGRAGRQGVGAGHGARAACRARRACRRSAPAGSVRWPTSRRCATPARSARSSGARRWMGRSISPRPSSGPPCRPR